MWLAELRVLADLAPTQAAMAELAGLGFARKIPGLTLYGVTDAGRGDAREHILSDPGRS